MNDIGTYYLYNYFNFSFNLDAGLGSRAEFTHTRYLTPPNIKRSLKQSGSQKHTTFSSTTGYSGEEQ